MTGAEALNRAMERGVLVQRSISTHHDLGCTNAIESLMAVLGLSA